MDKQPATTQSAQPEVLGPRVLSLHPTSICALNCEPCYLMRDVYGDEKPLSFFASIVREAATSDSIREVALAVNIDPASSNRNKEALSTVSDAVRDAHVSLSVTTNYENLKSWGAKAFSDCHLVSLSIDVFKFPGLDLPSDFFDQVTQLQSEGIVVNLNVLLSKALLTDLTPTLLQEWLGVADQVYLVVPKHYNLDFKRQDLLAFFESISSIWEQPDRFFHLQIDNCIRPEVFPWNQLSPNCEWAESLVNILPDGGLTLCAMDIPQVRLESSGELLDAINRYYIEQRQQSRNRCPFIEFNDE